MKRSMIEAVFEVELTGALFGYLALVSALGCRPIEQDASNMKKKVTEPIVSSGSFLARRRRHTSWSSRRQLMAQVCNVFDSQVPAVRSAWKLQTEISVPQRHRKKKAASQT